MTEILLIRHGETDCNVERRLQGHLDTPLNAEGERQARALGHALLDEELDAIVSSDLLRARQTAQQIAEPRNMMVQIDTGLRERCYGAFEGLLHSEIGARYPEAYAAWKSRDFDARFPQGARIAETLREFSQRAVNAITSLASQGEYRKLALVTHGGVLECVYRAAQGIGFAHARDFDIFNAGINRFAWNGERIRLLQWGDISHLKTTDGYSLDETDR